MHQEKNVAWANSVPLQRLNTGATPAGMTSTSANLDCLVNFLPRSFGERIFVDCSSSYGLFLVNDAAAFLTARQGFAASVAAGNGTS
jgi:hypothetical protein